MLSVFTTTPNHQTSRPTVYLFYDQSKKKLKAHNLFWFLISQKKWDDKHCLDSRHIHKIASENYQEVSRHYKPWEVGHEWSEMLMMKSYCIKGIYSNSSPLLERKHISAFFHAPLPYTSGPDPPKFIWINLSKWFYCAKKGGMSKILLNYSCQHFLTNTQTRLSR